MEFWRSSHGCFQLLGEDVYIIDFLKTLIAKDQDRNVTCIAPVFPPQGTTDNAFPWRPLSSSSIERELLAVSLLGFKKPEAVRDGVCFSLGIAERAVSAV